MTAAGVVAAGVLGVLETATGVVVEDDDAAGDRADEGVSAGQPAVGSDGRVHGMISR